MVILYISSKRKNRKPLRRIHKICTFDSQLKHWLNCTLQKRVLKNRKHHQIGSIPTTILTFYKQTVINNVTCKRLWNIFYKMHLKKKKKGDALHQTAECLKNNLTVKEQLWTHSDGECCPYSMTQCTLF